MSHFIPGLLLAAALAVAAAVRVDAPAAAEPPIFSTGNRFLEQDGAALYRSICQGCHMADARGAAGAGRYPALADNPKLGAKMFAAHRIVHGAGAMPGFGNMLDDAQIASLVNYVRTHFGNRFSDAITPEEVRALRP